MLEDFDGRSELLFARSLNKLIDSMPNKPILEVEPADTAPSRVNSWLRLPKYIPALSLIGAVIGVFVIGFKSTFPSEYESSLSGSGLYWDKKVKIGCAPDDMYRTVYVNLDSKTPCLLLLIFAVVRAYFVQLSSGLSAAARLLGIICADQTSCGSKTSWQARKPLIRFLCLDLLARMLWGLATSFGTFYSGYILFMYINDSFYGLVVVQFVFSVI